MRTIEPTRKRRTRRDVRKKKINPLFARQKRERVAFSCLRQIAADRPARRRPEVALPRRFGRRVRSSPDARKVCRFFECSSLGLRARAQSSSTDGQTKFCARAISVCLAAPAAAVHRWHPLAAFLLPPSALLHTPPSLSFSGVQLPPSPSSRPDGGDSTLCV